MQEVFFFFTLFNTDKTSAGRASFHILRNNESQKRLTRTTRKKFAGEKNAETEFSPEKVRLRRMVKLFRM